MQSNPTATEPYGLDTGTVADDTAQRIWTLPEPSTDSIRRVRREFSRRLRDASAAEVLAVVEALVDRQRWVAYELLYWCHAELAKHLVLFRERRRR